MNCRGKGFPREPRQPECESHPIVVNHKARVYSTRTLSPWPVGRGAQGIGRAASARRAARRGAAGTRAARRLVRVRVRVRVRVGVRVRG